MSGARRLSVRLSQSQLDRLRERCQQAGLDTSYVVRLALDAFLANDQGAAGSGSVPQRLHPPDAAIQRTGPYIAWGRGDRGDLRDKRRDLFLELVAAAFVCKNQWSRTPGVVEGYVGLLQLCKFFGVQ